MSRASSTVEPAVCGEVGEAAPLPPRVLGRLGRADRGPLLLCVAGLHGNEPSGVRALERVFSRLSEAREELAGQLLGLTGNRPALAGGRRFIDHDLNRAWREENVARVRREGPVTVEDRELLELEGELRRALESAPGRVFLLDLHSMSGGGPAFAVLDDTLPNRRFALELPVPLVLGIEEELTGTLSDYLAGFGVTTLGFEAGQHDDEHAPDRAEAAVWIALAAAGVIERGARPEVDAARELLRSETRGLPHVLEVRYRHPVSVESRFAMELGFESFSPVEKGEVLARDAGGPVRAPESGLVLMPLYQRQGEDGFFIVRPVRRLWLELSAALRKLRPERFLHWFPGVSRHPTEAATFVVDRRIARWLGLEIFHLLGFRRREIDRHRLVMRRRRYAAGGR